LAYDKWEFAGSLYASADKIVHMSCDEGNQENRTCHATRGSIVGADEFNLDFYKQDQEVPVTTKALTFKRGTENC
jgi:predicted metal-dependent phosphotriesterase family hydrolase